ncbi:hypothetical protein ACSAZK_00615 [Methanosarcina sp. Mfa9]|uniref:hypothetical protein n=1 Tax=Methanosarcina sp. Mfa9 TaxID=3439063 RepID=UPI003F84FB55
MLEKNEVIPGLLEAQAPEGAFPSYIWLGEKVIPDLNSFTTAQVLRALRDVAGPEALAQAKEKALDFLLMCRAPDLPGAFRYWPENSRPAFIPELPADADDTAVVLLELLRSGRVDLAAVAKTTAEVLVPCRLKAIHEPAPPWLRPGVFLTWLGCGEVNIVDCCVNANVAALFAYAGLQGFPGYREACLMIEEGILWAGKDKERIRCLTPFYPQPAEFVYAIRNAVVCGAKELEKSLWLVNSLGWMPENLRAEDKGDLPICSDAYGTIFWKSGVLQKARGLNPELFF